MNKVIYRTLIKAKNVRLLFKCLPLIFLVLVFCLALLVIRDYRHYRALFVVTDIPDTSKSSGADLSGRNNFNKNRSILDEGVFSSSGKLSRIDSSIKGYAPGPLLKKAVPDDNLLLMGTIMPGYAFFENKQSKRQELYREGEKIFDRGILLSVEKYSAQVDVGGSVFTYTMVSVERQSGAPVAMETTRRVYEKIVRDEAPKHPSRANENIAKRTGVDEWEVSSGAVDKIIKNVSSVMSHARLSTYMEEGVAKGYKINKIKASGVFSKVGLKNGDVILNVNGYEVTSMTNLVKLFAILKIKGKMDITINLIRAGKDRTLNYKMV